MKRFLTWLGRKLSPGTDAFDQNHRQKSPRISPVSVRKKLPVKKLKPKPPAGSAAKTSMVDFSTEKPGSIADGGPGKNVLIQYRHIREDTGTHDTLKIVEDSIPESEENGGGVDPYNTGSFDTKNK